MEIELVGRPDGQTAFIGELGCKVGTFTQETEKPCLRWHVPLDMRGPFRPRELCNFKPENTYRIDSLGYVLCYGKTKEERFCNRRAINRSRFCSFHGGDVHPLDKVVKDKETAKSVAEMESLSRYRQFQAGYLTVDDLDDEELAHCGFRSKNGNIHKPKNVPREVIGAFQKAIFDRATTELKHHTVGAAKTMARLATDPSVDDNIQFKAAQDILDRNLGRAQQVISLTTDAPWEEVFSGIATLSREESRAARQLNNQNELPSGSEVLDVDVVSDPVVSDSIDNGDIVADKQPITRDRLFERNEAILNPVIEKLDLDEDPTDMVAAEELSYYRSLNIPLQKEETKTDNGTIFVKYHLPKELEEDEGIYSFDDF